MEKKPYNQPKVEEYKVRNWFREFDSNPAMNQRNIIRYSNAAFNQPESVLTHSGEMQEMIILLYNDLYKPNNVTFDVKDAVYRAFMHDYDETVLCDIPRNIKYFDDEIHEKLEVISRAVLAESNFSDEILNDIFTAKDPTKFEGNLVKVMDIIQAMHKLSKELKLQCTYNIFAKFNESYGYLTDKINHFSHFEGDQYKLLVKFMTEVQYWAKKIIEEYKIKVM